MFVTCPRCGRRIRETDYECPHCDLKDAGKGSKEYNQELVKKVKKMGGSGSFFHVISRRPCIDGSSHNNYGPIINVGIQKDGMLYQTVVTYKCGRCRKNIKARVNTEGRYF